MAIYKDKQFDEERALYGIKGAKIENCIFDGPADGESALKESRDIEVEKSVFRLRYPFWHTTNGVLSNITMTDTCRAALWYDENIVINDSILGGIKALRECKNITLKNCDISSKEFCWRCSEVTIDGGSLESEYPFFECSGMTVENFYMKGKYSFQYVKGLHIKNCNFDTKDAFWHAEDVVVEDSTIKGEYLGWYAKNLKFINCKIIGTQPLCYCDGLVLENCEMLDTDLSFENSYVEADIKGHIISVKNPTGGFIKADSIGEIILDEYLRPGSDCRITTK